MSTQIEEAIKTNVKTLMADKRLFYYAFKEWVVQLALFLIWLISVAFFAISIWALTDTGFYRILIREYPFFTQNVLTTISIFNFPIIILSLIFSIYFSNRFSILAFYRSYNVLQNKAIDTNKEMSVSKGKIWLVFKLRIWMMLKTIRLSALQIKKVKGTPNNSDLVFYDPTLVLPIVLFENLSKEEAFKISSEIGSKRPFLFIKQAYKRDFSLIGYNFKILGSTIIVVIILWSLLGEYLNPLTLFAITLLIYFCIQTFAMLKRKFFREAYLIALYCAIRKTI